MPLAASLSGCLRYDHIDAGESPEMSSTSEFCDQDQGSTDRKRPGIFLMADQRGPTGGLWIPDQDHDIADIRPVIEEIHQFEQ